MRSLLYAPLLLAACGSSGPTTIVVNASGFTKDDGKTVKVAASDPNSNAVRATGMGTISGGGASFTLDVDPNTTYRIDLFVDTDGNSVCEFGVDDVVSTTQTDVSEGKTATVSFTPASAAPDGCLSFGGKTLKLTGTNLTANKVYIAYLLKKKPDNSFQKLGLHNGVTGNGSVDIEFPGGVISGNFYRVDLYIDINSNNTCDTSDPAYRKDSGALGPSDPGPLTLTLDGNVDMTNPDVCNTFK